MIGDCESCKYELTSAYDEPCDTCIEIEDSHGNTHAGSNWEPKNNEKAAGCKTCRHQTDPAGSPDVNSEVCESCRRLSHWEPLNNGYTFRGGIPPIKFITSNNMSFIEGNIIKYIYRYPVRGGLKDLHKVKAYLEWLIKTEEEKDAATTNNA